jgi:hypothetical protein
MKASKFLDAQKAFILKQGSDGISVADICRKAAISTTYFNWKKKYDGLLPHEMRRRQTNETAIIERYRRRESSVEEALIEMYLAGISVRRVEDITEASEVRG